MDKFDPKWPHGHVTRDGRRAEIIRDNLRGSNPIVAIITDEDGEEHVESYGIDGTFFLDEESERDLFNAPAPRVGLSAWVNFYIREDGALVTEVAHTRELANRIATSGRVACIECAGFKGDGIGEG